MVCKLRGANIVWSCHNIYEHGIPSRKYGDCLRWMLARASSSIIVFHPSLQKYLGSSSDKVLVANFGSYKEFILGSSLEKQPEFLVKYRSWLNDRGRRSADIVFIGEYKARKNIELLVEFARNEPSVNVLIVAQKMAPVSRCPKNLMLHNQTQIFGELDEVLRGEGLVGFVGHDNYSVPTGIHLYADYGVPLIGVNLEPVTCFIKDYNCGAVFSDLESLQLAYREVRKNRELYARGIERLAVDNTWEQSAAIHTRAFALSE